MVLSDDSESGSISSDSSSFHSVENDDDVEAFISASKSITTPKAGKNTDTKNVKKMRKSQRKFFDCVSDVSISSNECDWTSGSGLPGTIRNGTEFLNSNHRYDMSYDQGDRRATSQVEMPFGGEVVAFPPDQEDVEAASTRSAYRNSATSCLARTFRMIHFAVSCPLQVFFASLFPSLHPPQTAFAGSRPEHLRITKSNIQSIEASFIVDDEQQALRLLLPAQRQLQKGSSSERRKKEQAEVNRVKKLHSPLWRAVTVLLLSVFFIALLTSIVVFISTSIVKELHLDSSTIGATLVALGSEVSSI